jgi:hypothetical protein
MQILCRFGAELAANMGENEAFQHLVAMLERSMPDSANLSIYGG